MGVFGWIEGTCMGGLSGGAWVDRVEVHKWIVWRCMGGSCEVAWLDRVEVHG